MPPLNPFGRSCIALAIGQVMALPTQAATITVDSPADTMVADTGCNLREAVESINAGNDTGYGCGGSDFGALDTINFDSSLAGSTIALREARLEIDRDVSIMAYTEQFARLRRGRPAAGLIGLDAGSSPA